MHPHFTNRNRIFLFIGVVFVLVGIAVNVYTTRTMTPEIEKHYGQMRSDLLKMPADTDNERELKSVCVEIISAAQQGWSVAMRKTAFNATLYMFFCGGLGIGQYFLRRKMKTIIEKYKNAPNQAL